MGLPALTFRAYYEARFGREAWVAPDRAPRRIWMDYLIWYRKVLDLPVRNGVSVDNILPRADGMLDIACSEGGAKKTIVARAWCAGNRARWSRRPVRSRDRRSMDRKYWAHTADEIDFGRAARQAGGRDRGGRLGHGQRCKRAGSGAACLDLFAPQDAFPRSTSFLPASAARVSSMASPVCRTNGSGARATP